MTLIIIIITHIKKLNYIEDNIDKKKDNNSETLWIMIIQMLMRI